MRVVARRGRRRRQQGHLMVGLVSMIAIMLILSTAAVQEWREVVRRDDEAEMIFRAQEIVRGLRRYQQDRGTLPIDLKDLIEPGNKGQYFIRRLYDDPLVPDGKWGLLYAAPGGGVYDPNAAEAQGAEQFTLGDRGPTATQGPVSGLGGAGIGGQSGLPIAGVKTLSTDKPFRYYKDLNDYRLWLFHVFDQGLRGPRAGPGGNRQQPGQQLGRQPGQRFGQPGGGSRRPGGGPDGRRR